MVTNFLGKTGVPIKYRAVMYKSVVQAVLLYTRKIWVVMDVIVTVLEVFHHRIERRIAGMAARKGCCGEWEWSLVDMVLEVTGSWPIREYVRSQQVTIPYYVAGRAI